jgi:RNA polymerase-binding transcription factor DksA
MINHREHDNVKNDSYGNEESYNMNHYLDNISAINNALKKISNNTYGNCIDCGNHIDFDILSVHPTERHCNNCKLISEKADQIHV